MKANDTVASSAMRIYLTHCSKEKETTLQGTQIAVTPDKLYTEQGIQQFMHQCQKEGVNWGVLSDLYGIYLATDCRIWYEKHPDTVTPDEEAFIIQDFNQKLNLYDEIYFFVRSDTFHPFYESILRKTLLTDRVNLFQNIDCIKAS